MIQRMNTMRNGGGLPERKEAKMGGRFCEKSLEYTQQHKFVMIVNKPSSLKFQSELQAGKSRTIIPSDSFLISHQLLKLTN